MRNKKIILAGGTGFIGQAIGNFFGMDNEIIVLGRQISPAKTEKIQGVQLGNRVTPKLRYVKWNTDTPLGWWQELEGADLIINLAGKSVNCRYTAKNKKEIFDSRINSTKVIAQAMAHCQVPPKLWINAASATIYPHATNTPRDEEFTDFADDFSVQVCKQWEQTFYEQQSPHTRKIALRMAITLGLGGVMQPYFNLLKFGLGGRQASGQQMFSWIHVEDTCRMIEWLEEHEHLSGTFNCSSPGPVTNAQFMETLRKVTGTHFGLPATGWMLKVGAFLIGTEAELVLKSRWVLPSRMLHEGFQFKFGLLEEAFSDLVNQTARRQYHLW